ncbi:hypothetical protein ERHA53_16650 [Erwinia rhapontici]|uniref:Uncharacterized protein n=1 Tax=Erwinia rhapontici TaxID=55212 RepID=A0ABN6DIE4_ERWRD|nr:hypothetical protein ERHA53_16650 [Erwinia rhapontici]
MYVIQGKKKPALRGQKSLLLRCCPLSGHHRLPLWGWRSKNILRVYAVKNLTMNRKESEKT